jgi:hypothetical protein
MGRRAMLEQQYGRALRAGLVVSIAAHALALGMGLRGPGTGDKAAHRPERVTPTQPLSPPAVHELEQPVMQVVALRERPNEAATISVASASSPAPAVVEATPGAPAPVAETAPAASPPAEVVAVDDAPPLPALDTHNAAPSAELAHTESAEAWLASAAEPEQEQAEAAPAQDGNGSATAVPLHTPGSVATAKGQWIGNTQPARGGGKGGVGVGIGSDCPDRGGHGPPRMPPISRSVEFEHLLAPSQLMVGRCSTDD